MSREAVKFKTYSDIRPLVSTAAFQNALAFTSWHNRLSMTPMLEIPQALVVAFACEHHQLDSFLFSAVKTFLDAHRHASMDTIESCRTLASEMTSQFFQSA